MLDVKQIKAVGFDVDGTLYHYSPEILIALSREVARVAAKALGKDIDKFVPEFLEVREKFKGNTLTLNAMGLNGEKIYQKIVDNFDLEKHQDLNKKLMAMISALKSKYRLFIITNGTERQVVRKLKVLGLTLRDFDPMICCYDHNWVKPEQAPFLLAIESLGLAPEEIVYVGDREDLDIEGARSSGMQTIYVGGKSELADASCETVYDLAQLSL
jgi:HAD superfamily hydrolase (TIGR01549 family)